MGKKRKSLSEMWLDAGIADCLHPPEVDEDSLTEPVYDSPHGSKWIVAVDHSGMVSVLDIPDIHFGFTEAGNSAEDLGLPPEVEDCHPGIYRWTCSYHEITDWESGRVDDWHFEVESEELLWSPYDA